MRHAGRAAAGRPNVLLAAAVALSLALGTAGCATATNYLDPNGPVYRDSSHIPVAPTGDALWTWAAGTARDVGNSSDHRPVWVVLRPTTTTPPGALSSGPTNGRTK